MKKVIKVLSFIIMVFSIFLILGISAIQLLCNYLWRLNTIVVENFLRFVMRS